MYEETQLSIDNWQGSLIHHENKPRMSALFNFDVLCSFAITVGFLINYTSHISGHYAGLDPAAGVARYAYFMVAMAFVSIVILFVRGVITNTGGLFIWLPVFYVVLACTSTAISGLFPVQRLPFRFVDMYYWVAVLILSYYSVLSLNTVKFHTAIIMLAIPFLAYKFYLMRGAESAYSDDLLLNPVYYIAYLMPVVLLLKSKLLKVGFLFLIFVVIVLSYKRTAMLAYFTSVLVYFYCLSRSNSNANMWRKAAIILGIILFIAVLAFSFRYMAGLFGLAWGERMGSMVESGGSGRVDIWHVVLMDIAANPAYWLLGHGYEATKQIVSTGAHNDFMEILYDFGLIGLIVYLLFVIKIVRIFLRMMRVRYKHFGAFAVSLVWFAFGSMFSMLINYPYWFLSIVLFWGITVADFENTQKEGCFTENDESLYMCQGDEKNVVGAPYE